MNYLGTIAIVLVAYLAVFLEAYVVSVRNWLGVQIDVIPVLMVYCGLSTGLFTLTLTAILAGLWYDALSANPLGVSVIPEFLVGFAAFQTRDILLREQPYARFILGALAGAIAPLITLLLLWGGGYRPLVGWGSLWQWFVLSLSAGALTPGCFWFFQKVNSSLAYSRPSETTFRPDREIKRGRG